MSYPYVILIVVLVFVGVTPPIKWLLTYLCTKDKVQSELSLKEKEKEYSPA